MMPFSLGDERISCRAAGHPQGGVILGFDRLLALANAGFASGRYRVGAMTLDVETGTGLWPSLAPARLQAPAPPLSGPSRAIGCSSPLPERRPDVIPPGRRPPPAQDPGKPSPMSPNAFWAGHSHQAQVGLRQGAPFAPFLIAARQRPVRRRGDGMGGRSGSAIHRPRLRGRTDFWRANLL